MEEITEVKTPKMSLCKCSVSKMLNLKITNKKDNPSCKHIDFQAWQKSKA